MCISIVRCGVWYEVIGEADDSGLDEVAVIGTRSRDALARCTTNLKMDPLYAEQGSRQLQASILV